MPTLGVVTAVRDRTEHLYHSAALLSRSRSHQQHLIVDWGSTPAVQRSQLPPDPRITLVQVEGEPLWWHSRAYNHAIRHCHTDWILRCDADCLLHPPFFEALQLRGAAVHVLTLPGGLHSEQHWESYGLIAAPRSSLAAIGGYEPLLVGWGFEDTDLLERLFLAGHTIQALPATGIGVLRHSDQQRRGVRSGLAAWLPPRLALEASHTANRAMARWLREQPPRSQLDDPGWGCINQLPIAVKQLRQRALLSGALALLAGRHGRWLAAQAPAQLVSAAVNLLQLDPLAVTATSRARARHGQAVSAPAA